MTNLISKSTQCPTVSVFTVWLFITSTPLVSALEARSSSSAEDKFWASTPLVLGILIVLAIAYHFISRYERRVRLHAILEGQEENVRDQSLFLHQRGVSAWLKNHIFYAPLVGKRHARELRIFNIASGIFPMRLEVFCVVLIYVVNLIYFLVGPPGRTFEKLTPSILSVRAGGLATANLLPLLLMSARCNPLTPLTGITFDKWNIGHRWVGRLIAIESILHVVYFAKKLIVKCKLSLTPQRDVYPFRPDFANKFYSRRGGREESFSPIDHWRHFSRSFYSEYNCLFFFRLCIPRKALLVLNYRLFLLTH